MTTDTSTWNAPAAIAKLHAACRRLSNLESADSGDYDKLKDARASYRESCRECERLGVDVAKELEGRGYLL